MWTAIKIFFSSNVAKIIEWLAIIGSATTAILTIFNAGKKSEQVKELVVIRDKVKAAHEVEDENRKLSNGDASKQLSSDWSR